MGAITEVISDNVRKIKYNGKEIYLVGTAHVLQESKEEVQRVIDEVEPDSVCVELCESRYNSLRDKNRWKNLDIVKVIKSGKGFLLFANFVLSSFQKRAGINLNSAPGEEMIQAINIAEEKNINLILADRDINTTLKRVWGLATFKEKMTIFEVLLESLFSKETVTKEQVDEMMEGGDLLSQMLEEFSKQLPFVKKALIDERDQFLANKIRNSSGNKIVAVIGKGHMNGIVNLIENEFLYNPEIEFTPPKKKTGKILSYLIPALVLLIIGWGFTKEKTVAFNMMKYWVLANGAFTSVACLLVLAHPLTIILAWAVSPITSLNPTIGAGIVLAIVEAFLRKPRVQDFENLSSDISSFKGFFKNRITKILLVFIMGSIGSTIGTFVGLPWIITLLK